MLIRNSAAFLYSGSLTSKMILLLWIFKLSVYCASLSRSDNIDFTYQKLSTKMTRYLTTIWLSDWRLLLSVVPFSQKFIFFLPLWPCLRSRWIRTTHKLQLIPRCIYLSVAVFTFSISRFLFVDSSPFVFHSYKAVYEFNDFLWPAKFFGVRYLLFCWWFGDWLESVF